MMALLLCWLTLSALAAPPVLEADVTSLVSLKERPYFQPHADRVSFPLPFAPVEKLRRALEGQLGKPLQHTGEAHITLITQSEWRVLSQVLKMNTLDKLVAEMGVMKSKLKARCVKKISSELAGHSEESWFITLDAPRLYRLRQKIWRRYLTSGGVAGDFQWKRWSPHVTVGFTSPQLHDEDSVSKDKSGCVYALKQSAASPTPPSPSVSAPPPSKPAAPR